MLISPYGENLTGGIAKWTGHIIRYYKKHQDDVSLKLLDNPQGQAVFAGTSMVRRIAKGVKNYFPVYRNFCREIKSCRYDVVHVCTSASISTIKDLCIVSRAKKAGIKTIVHCHFGRIPEILESKGWEHRLFVKLMSIVDRLAVMDMRTYNCLISAGYKNVVYLPNPLSPEILSLISTHVNNKRIPNKIVFAGHVVRGKGVYELVTACKSMQGIETHLYGPIPQEEDKKNLIDLAGDGYGKWFFLHGAVPIETVIGEMMTAGIFVLPTYSEGFPNVILESMACGCPIVSTPVGAIPEMLDIESQNPCGICVPSRNVERLREAIECLLEDTVLAAEYGNRAKSRVNEMYNIQNVWKQLLSVWNDVATS